MNKYRGFQNGWWIILITLCVMYITTLLFILIPSSTEFYSVCNGLSLAIPIFVGLVMINSEKEKDKLSEMLGIRRFSLKILPFLIIIAPCAQLFSNVVFAAPNAVSSFLFGAVDYDDLLQGTGVNSVLTNFVVICVLAPLFEEILCRGILMHLFRHYGVASMLVFSSLAFSILHQSAALLLPTFFLGLLIGIVRITTGSVFASMIVHSANNLFSLIILYSGDMNVLAEILLIISGVVLFPILMYRYLIKYTNNVNADKLNRPNKSNPGISAGLILCCLFCFIYNISMLVIRLFSGEMFYELSTYFR